MQIIYSLSSGGAEKFVVDLSNELLRRGHEVILCMLLNDKDEILVFNRQFLRCNVEFYSMKFDRGFSMMKCAKLEEFIISKRPDIIHCHLNVIPYVFRFLLFNKRIVVIHTLHNIASETVRGFQYYMNKFYYSLNLIHPVCISKICLESYRSFYHLNNAKMINNGRSIVDKTPRFSEVVGEVDSYKITPNTKVFIHVARFCEQKNQGLLIESFNRIDDENEDFILLVIGDGYESKQGFDMQHKSCSKIFYLGRKNNVNDYLLCSDAFCLTSLYEGLPISILEALSCGVTPICTPVGGIPDVIVDGINGYLSSEINIDSYCKAIKSYIKKPISRKYLIDYYNDNFSISTCAERYEKLYLSCLTK